MIDADDDLEGREPVCDFCERRLPPAKLHICAHGAHVACVDMAECSASHADIGPEALRLAHDAFAKADGEPGVIAIARLLQLERNETDRWAKRNRLLQARLDTMCDAASGRRDGELVQRCELDGFEQPDERGHTVGDAVGLRRQLP